MTADELEALYQAALAEHQAGRLPAAVDGYQAVLRQNLQFARAWHLLGVACQQLGQPGPALEYIQRAIALEPERDVFHANLGSVLTSLGRPRDAEPHLRRAIELAPRNSLALVALASVLIEQNRSDEALPLLHRALALNPLDSAALGQLGLASSELGQVAESIAAYERAHAISGDALLTTLAASQLPLVYESAADVLASRERLEARIDALLAAGLAADISQRPPVPIFNLPHQGLQDRALLEKYTRLFRPPPLDTSLWQPAADARLRVGFLSGYLSQHTIGKLFRGLLLGLSRTEIQVTLFSAGQHDDPLARELADAADRHVVLTRDLPAARRAVLANSVDVLVYPDIGMHAIAYALAFSRLAPVQCTTWGHPETTGLPTIDYFVSSALMEAPGAEAHYSERLVLLPSLSLDFQRSELPEKSTLDRAALGLDPQARLYACPQSIYKFHPAFDAALAGILRRDSAGQIVLIQWAYPQADELLRRRFARSMPDVFDRLVFIRRLQPHEFMQFLTLADVLLDPFPYGGGNSSLEAFSVGVPVVTLPTEFLRGRITQAFCRRLQIEDCIARDVDDYVDIATRLGTNLALRDSIRQRILANQPLLYGDPAALRDWEDFLKAVRKP